MSARFITIEGGEGAGKSTQAGLLARALEGAGLRVVLTREPGGAPGADVLRGLLLSGDVAWSLTAETLLHFAARAEHVARTVGPALAGGAWVVCDRYADSTLAYQGYAQGGDAGLIEELARRVAPMPDLTIVLDVETALAEARLLGRGGAPDRYERLGADFFERVRQGFLRIAHAHPERCVVVPAAGGTAEVAAAIRAVVRERLSVDL